MRFEPRSRTAWLIPALLVLASTLACADFRRGDYWEAAETGETGTGGGALGYADEVHPLLVSGCERCHAPGGSAGNTDFEILTDDVEGSYASTLSFVDLDAPTESRLLGKTAGNGHAGGTIYDDRSLEYDTILAWIEQGAPP